MAWLRRWSHRLRQLLSVTNDPHGQNAVERPWLHSWEHVPKRSAGFGFRRTDYQLAHQRACAVARLTLGDALWTRSQQQGYLDVPSTRISGMTYRLRMGRRIEVICAPGTQPPWSQPFLCVNPTYPLPEEEFFAQLYLYIRDREDLVLAIAAPQPWDQALGRTF